MSQICVRVIYSGRVQGVGFRYTAASVARSFAVTGYVKNLPDGTVELVACGERDVIDDFLQGVRRAMAGNIHNEQRTELPAPESFESFSIRR